MGCGASSSVTDASSADNDAGQRSGASQQQQQQTPLNDSSNSSSRPPPPSVPGSALATVSSDTVLLLPKHKEELAASGGGTTNFSNAATTPSSRGHNATTVTNKGLSGTGLDALAEHRSASLMAPSVPRDADAERADLLSKLLVCGNCEDPVQVPAVWCAECHRADDPNPPVYCESCNTDLHQFAKTRSHVRESLVSLHTTRMKSAAELGFIGTTLPSGLPPMESLACSNCEGDVQIFCTACKTLLCADCARDIHNPKLLRGHTRRALQCKFVHASVKANAKGVEQRLGAANAAQAKRAAAGGADGTGSTSASKSSLGSAQSIGAALMRLDTRRAVQPVTVVPSPSSASVVSTSKGPLALGTGGKPRVSALALISKGGAANSMMKSNSSSSISAVTLTAAGASGADAASALPLSAIKRVKVRRPLSPSGRDLPASENPGVGGDVFSFGDPSLDGSPLANLAQLEFRNLSNPFDKLGSGLQIVQVSAGMDHAGAVTAMGSLFMWGSNVESQLGCGKRLGAERHSSTPLLIEFPRHAPVRMVACGSVHTLALTQCNAVFSWGDAKMGKLGHGSDLDAEEPREVLLGHWGPRGEREPEDMSGDEQVVTIAVGQNNSGAVVRGRKDKCQLYLWGEGASGQIPRHPDLGPASAELVPSLFPSLVLIHTPAQGSDPYPELACLGLGTKHVAVSTRASGAVFTWGDGSFGALGYTLSNTDGDNLALQLTPRLVPKLFLDGVKARAIACGERHTTVLSTTGDVWSFGSGESHQIGIMDNVDQFQPQRAVGLGPGASNVITSVSVGASISAAVNEAGEVYLWGYGVESPIPKLVDALKGQVAQVVAVGSNANMALLTGYGREMMEWQFDGAPLDAEETHGNAAGEAAQQQLIAGLTSHGSSAGEDSGHGGGKGVPQVNAALRGKKIVSLSAGKSHYMCVTGEGKLYGWGSNHLHECGLKLPGDISYVPHPLAVSLLSGAQTIVTEVKCGVEHSICLDSLGRVHTWGMGFEGRLGHTSNADVPQPKLVQALVDSKVTVTGLAIGPSNTGVTCADGSAWLWGAGNAGQLGNDDLLPAFAPSRVRHLAHEKVTALALGNYHAMLLTASGTVYTTGENRFGQLGLHPQFQEEHAAYPQPVTALQTHKVTPVAVDCGDNVCLVLSAAGEVWGWGTGETMQLCRRQPPKDGGEGGAEADPAAEDYGAGEDVPYPVKLAFPFQTPGNMLKITSISVRDINCCCLTEDGALYSWGWELGEFPSKLALKKPSRGSAAASAAQAAQAAAANGGGAAAAAAAAGVGEYKFDKVALGHTRMLLLSA